MKRLFLTVVALTMMSATFASNKVVNNNEKFDMSYNVRKLGCRLDLTVDQLKEVKDIQDSFVNEMNAASSADETSKEAEVKEAIKTNFKKMRFVLNKNQFGKYEKLMSVTFENKGLNNYLK